MSNPNDYTVGWICTISTEYVAARAILDEEHKQLEYVPPNDNDNYTLGKIRKHNVVITALPNRECNISSAAIVTTHMLHSFPNVAFVLMVVIGGGTLSQYHDMCLGDIVVGASRGRQGGAFYDIDAFCLRLSASRRLRQLPTISPSSPHTTMSSSTSLPVQGQLRTSNHGTSDSIPRQPIPKAGSRSEKQRERERDQAPGGQQSSEPPPKGGPHHRPNPSLKRTSGAGEERGTETIRATTRETLVSRHRSAEHVQQADTRTKANALTEARPNYPVALQPSWNPTVCLIPQTTAPLATRVSAPPSASQAPQSLQPTPLHELSLEVQEAVIIEDLVLVLMGYEGQYIRFAKSYNNTLEQDRIAGPGYSISSGLDRSLQQLATSILKVATHYKATEAFIEVQSRAEFGLVNHALCAALRKSLRNYLVLIGQLETQFLTNSSFTLHVLNLYILPASRLMFQIYRLAHDISQRNALLKDQDSDDDFDDVSIILKSLREGGDAGLGRFFTGGSVLALVTERLELMAGDPTARSLLTSLLSDASRPYMIMLNEWLHHGIVKDPHGEFMIREQRSIKRERLEEDYTDEYWDRRYTIRDDVPPQLEAVKSKILLAGKYLNVVRECRRVNIKAITDSPLSFGDVRFLENVNNAYSHANESLLQLLLTTYDLPMRLHSLKHYFILQSDFFSSFLELGASELRKPVDKVNTSKLQSLLDLVLRQPGSSTAQDPFKEDVKVEMNPVSLTDSLTRVVNISGEQGETLVAPLTQPEAEKGPIGYTSLQLDYIVPFPVSLVIGRKTIWRYQVLFRYLLSLRHLEQQLVANWQTQNRTSCWSFKSSNTELEIWKRRAFALRARMLVFIQQLLYFCTSEVIEPNWQAFMAKLVTAAHDKADSKPGIRTVDELMGDHVDFLDTCLKECMLTNSRLLKRHSKIARTCTLFASFTNRVSRELEKGDPELSDSEQPATMVKKFELNFGRHVQLLLDELNHFAATETVVLLGLCARLISANWSSETKIWSLEVVGGKEEKRNIEAKFVIYGSGYYNYDEPLQTSIPNISNFKGTIIHPQFWPQDLDYSNKKIIISSSGATAVTLLPVLAETAAIVTMLQRSPTKFFPSGTANLLIRWRFMWAIFLFFQYCRVFSNKAIEFLKVATEKQLLERIPQEPHFKPAYKPWEQRLCVCPDGEFYRVLRQRNAHVVTDTIGTVTETGILTTKGTILEADIIITATGLKTNFAGGTKMTVDGTPIDFSEKYL
ncbi:hypothetical protein G7Y89_g12420 [Cudoniella acicularis]|uniref:Spindle pole body component n=1 Tax=Cudoniella acicularis TaxID=354080 RepID=A0A8H4RB87_9HELO|nr:hypothetical protein G7Y89_g12420 [Cudoniella acicularis]